MAPGSDTWMARVAPIERTTAEAGATYDRLARWYDVVEAPFERRARAAGLRLLDIRSGEDILEVGFGTGHTLAAAAVGVGATGSVTGVDLSLRMAAVASRRLARHHLPVAPSLVQADLRHLPLGDGSVDGVTMSFTLELIATADIPIALGECRRVLRPTGRLAVVSLLLPGGPSAMVRLYLAAHRRWPRVVDCRPLPVRDVLAGNGFVITSSWNSSIGGLPVIAMTARPG